MRDPPSTEEILEGESPFDKYEDDPVWDLLGHRDWFDKEGREISFRQWAKLRAVKEYARVAEQTIGPYWVSTVWLGIDHWIGPVPLIFESMVFKGGESGEMARYSTLEQALEGHARMVEEVAGLEER